MIPVHISSQLGRGEHNFKAHGIFKEGLPIDNHGSTTQHKPLNILLLKQICYYCFLIIIALKYINETCFNNVVD